MNKAQLIDKLSVQLGSKKAATEAVEAVIEGLPDDLRLDPPASPAAPTGLVFRKPAAVEAVWTGS